MLVKGKITDYEGFPIFDATVVIKGSDPIIGATANFDGNYAINVNRGDILKFSHVGTNQIIERNVTASMTTLDIAMPNELQLPETVVIGKKRTNWFWLPLVIVGGAIAVNQSRKEKATPKKIKI
ncbi:MULTISPECIES: carboxypeptidase-like regulatory domain-containing protein [Flavobacterium]|uniref:Carboxypeptidase-like regulatory domain-containing protein n=1 Tax=Flavobacterium jumunjinense TaxID=998845 RepID=A0ABV5GTV6_9FLAO|nr:MULTISPECIES: carboxypeptidase-like regulatory domain-containing protein [Flavobacterium]